MLIGNNSIEIYCDGADTVTMQNVRRGNMCSGFTTNPSLCRSIGVTDYLGFCRAAARVADGWPVSVEVLGESPNEIVEQARTLHELNDNIFVKIPFCTSRGASNIHLISMLAREEIKINVTAVFTWEQMHTSSVVLGEAGIDSIISVFAGRIFDTGADAESLLKRFTTTHKTPSNVKMLWASPREVYNVVQASRCGCDVITLFPKFIEKLSLFGKSLDEYSRETAAMFARDAKEAGYTL